MQRPKNWSSALHLGATIVSIPCQHYWKRLGQAAGALLNRKDWCIAANSGTWQKMLIN